MLAERGAMHLRAQVVALAQRLWLLPEAKQLEAVLLP
jgi:hypothetical protein